MRIAIITGTMPDIIKQAPLILEADKRGHDVCIVHSNQHYDDKIFIKIFESIKLRKPNIILTNKFTEGNAINEFMEIFRGLKPDIVLPHGDTKTAMTSAVAAHYLGIPVGHVEAGLRTGSREPWPEQTCTRIVDSCSNLFFASTELNKKNLLREGFNKEDILVCGNTVVDIAKKIAEEYPKLKDSNIVYFSAHREENLRDVNRFINIVKFANYLASNDAQVYWVMRIKTQQKLKEYNLELDERIHKVDSLTYPRSIELLKKSTFVCTDSGGIQEEASALHIPCLTLRYITDRPETVTVGCNIVSTLNYDKMIKAVEKLALNHKKMSKIKCPYGDGNSAKLILDFIEKRKGDLIRWEK